MMPYSEVITSVIQNLKYGSRPKGHSLLLLSGLSTTGPWIGSDRWVTVEAAAGYPKILGPHLCPLDEADRQAGEFQYLPNPISNADNRCYDKQLAVPGTVPDFSARLVN